MRSKTPSYEEAKELTRKRLEKAINKGSVPQDVMAMAVLLIEAHKGRDMRHKVDKLEQIINKHGRINKADWDGIFFLTNNVIDA